MVSETLGVVVATEAVATVEVARAVAVKVGLATANLTLLEGHLVRRGVQRRHLWPRRRRLG